MAQSPSLMNPGILAVLAALLLAVPAAGRDKPPSCARDGVVIDADFEGGSFGNCRIRRSGRVDVTVVPEDDSVSSSFSWFALRASSPEETDLSIRLNFPGSYARFWPKISDDGVTWRRAGDGAVTTGTGGRSMRIRVTADADGTWISAQELLTLPYYEAWFDQLRTRHGMDIETLGQSVEGRPIRLASTSRRPESVLLLGRQHPVEVPGAMAMRRFVDTLLGDSETATKFRERYTILIIPLVNPDGVVNGHARHNSGATDLNRDWGPFTQPETRSVQALLERLDADGIRPRLMLDFHATRETDTMIFYTQVPDDNTVPRLFATRWLGAVANRTGDFPFTHAPRVPSGLDNTKNYFFRRYGIPAITFELADEIGRDAIDDYTPVFAEEMMQVMLEEPLLPTRD